MGSTSVLTLLTVLSVFTALFAVIFQAYLASNDLMKLTTILQNMKTLENQIPSHKARVAIGYGSCSDLYVKAVDFLNFTESLENALSQGTYNVDDINTEDEFLQSFAYYFQRGAAAERFTSNKELFQNLVRLAKKSSTAEPRWALGGNAPVIGSRLAMEGAEVMLAAKMSSKLKSHLRPDVRLVGSSIDDDDIHLILEYKTGDEWGTLKSPRANRYILHNDHNNPFINSLEEFELALPEFNPHLFVVSGLQMMDNYVYQPGVRESRIEKVRAQMQSQPSDTLVHFEMASFVELELFQLLLKDVIPYSDSLGMNEQELDNLQQVLETGKISLVADCNPRVALSLDQLRAVIRILNNDYYMKRDADPNRRMLSRIHLHTLAYQAIVTAKGTSWNNTKNAAAKASLTAHRHVCASSIVNPDAAYRLLDDSFATSTLEGARRIPFSKEDPVSCWNETIPVNNQHQLEVEICVAPVLICKVAKQTAGAGDNISGAGLVLQI
ncbi:ADP-dependent glucokinase [Toxorhynchites rutilus septentrionalis]|uniref:ADP-dependent glucokinase n=1 Tax=Toxorhynchites rutilus septentrionalis TaxID=329112 RepID=UPI00247A84E8|nr:ADP-dependent glucokinase [Toxorhynchites rutilus septentrionalis]